MLQNVYGRAGCGKTEYLMQQLCQKAGQGGKVMLLVPEQFSFESERAVYRRLGPRGMMGVEVVSFTTLCRLIFRLAGGEAGRRLDEPTRLLLMSAAVDEAAPQLDLYAKSAYNSTFLEMMTGAVSQFKFAGLTPESLRETADALPAGEQSQLGQKLREFSAVYEAFQALVDRSYSDPLDDLGRAARAAAQTGFFAGWNLYIDSFMSFTGSQIDLLKVALEDCESVTAAFSGLPEEAGDPNSMFYSSLESAMLLEHCARGCFAEVLAPVVLREAKRFAASGPAAAEALLCGKTPVQGGCEGLTLAACRHPYDEVEHAAAEIAFLAREKGLRYREIAVICRDLERYRAAAETVFARYEIPVFLDRVTDLQSHPLVSALISALEAVRGGWDTGELLSLAKTPSFGFTVEESARLENYCFVWSVEGRMWESDFTVSPGGLRRSDPEADRAALEELNALRRRIIEPLQPLRRLARGCAGMEFARACYDFLQQSHCVEHMRDFCRSLPRPEQKSALETADAVWERLMAVLDVFAAALEGVTYPLARFSDLLQMAVGRVDVGQIPTTLDQVSLGAADRMRPQSPRAVFLLGANEGVFPAACGQQGLFSEKETRLLAAEGIRIGAPAFQQILEERFFFYRSAAAPSEYLYLLWAESEPSGTALEPAPQAELLAKQFPEALVPGHQELMRRVVNKATAREELARHFRPGDPDAGSLAAFLQRGGAEETGRLFRAESPSPAGDISAEAAGDIFRKTMYLSASRVEDYYRCPYHYFCRYGLKVEPLTKAEFSPLESGSAIHYVMEQMVSRHGGQPLLELSSDDLHREVVELMDGYLQGLLSDPEMLGDRKLYLFHRMVRVLVHVLRHLGAEFAQSVFQPAGTEVAVGPDGPILPLEVEGRGGVRVSVRGSIDRVDLMEEGNMRYARVVDYKSGGKKFELSDVYYGLNMQMLIYLFALCEGGQGQYAGCSPAGILYFPAKAEMQSLSRNIAAEEALEKLGGSMAMNGLLLDDRHVLEAMEEALSGRFIPVKLGKKGYNAAAQLANPAEFEKIRRHVRRLIAAMGEQLVEGGVAPRPFDGISGKACEYCDYARLCHRGRMAEQPIRPVLKNDEFYRLLEEEERRMDDEQGMDSPTA